MLSNQQIAARKFRERQKRIRMFESRLDRHVIYAEKFQPGTETRTKHIALAEQARLELHRLGC